MSMLHHLTHEYSAEFYTDSIGRLESFEKTKLFEKITFCLKNSYLQYFLETVPR